jgi:hypothetical protein
MRSWKTTLSGFVSSGAGLVLALSTAGVPLPKWAIVTAAFVMAGGFASLGIFGKDSNVSGVNAPPSKDQASK